MPIIERVPLKQKMCPTGSLKKTFTQSWMLIAMTYSALRLEILGMSIDSFNGSPLVRFFSILGKETAHDDHSSPDQAL